MSKPFISPEDIFMVDDLYYFCNSVDTSGYEGIVTATEIYGIDPSYVFNFSEIQQVWTKNKMP